MPSYRCSCLASTTRRICKHNYTYLIKDVRCCTTHAKIKFNKYITKIQSLYRGYVVREKINTIFKPLPRELQCKIIWHMRDELYLQQLNKSLRNILKNRVTKTFDITYEDRLRNVFNLQHIQRFNEYDPLDENINYLKQISDIYYLHDKYFDIADLSDINILISWWNREIRKLFVRSVYLPDPYSCVNSVHSMAEQWSRRRFIISQAGSSSYLTYMHN